MPKGIERSPLPDRVCAYPVCAQPFHPTKARQRFCHGKCRSMDHKQRTAMRLMPIADIVAMIDQLKVELIRRAEEWEARQGRGGG